MADELKVDPGIARSLPGGEIDLTTYEQIEEALDLIDAPLRDENGRYLKLHERIAAAGRDAARYRWLRERDLDTIHSGGVFAGRTPQNVLLNLEHLDEAIDAAMAESH